MNIYFSKYMDSMKQFKRINMAPLLDGLSRGEISAMMCIKYGNTDGKKVKVSELSKDSKVNFTAMSRTLKGLEKKELIVRTVSKEDRRITYVDLTEKGMELTKNIEISIDNVTDSITAKMGADNMEQFTMLLDRLVNASIETIDEVKEEKKRRENKQ